MNVGVSSRKPTLVGMNSLCVRILVHERWEVKLMLIDSLMVMFLGWVAHRGPQSRRRCSSAQAKPARLVCAGASALHIHPLPPFGLNSGDTTGTQELGVPSSLPFVGPFYRSLCAQSTAQPPRADPFTSINGSDFCCGFARVGLMPLSFALLNQSLSPPPPV